MYQKKACGMSQRVINLEKNFSPTCLLNIPEKQNSLSGNTACFLFHFLYFHEQSIALHFLETIKIITNKEQSFSLKRCDC